MLTITVIWLPILVSSCIALCCPLLIININYIMLNTDSRGFLVENLNELNKEHSPSIPTSFPKDRLPSKAIY